ncbi:hypothetical protein D3H35_29370 [Cohnella faecalis]|uniref:Fibronectin type III domain-containing protein n=1 Tax=Cohnella faecalis TaxID=2315694 RepID=A0A398CCZ0_9BACL|nr:hypothetical protein D3H35_29370 [Cohnella faecalis]
MKITESDTIPPAPAVEMTTEADNNEALISWKLQGDPGISLKFRRYTRRKGLRGRNGDRGSCGSEVCPAGRLSGSTTYEIEVRYV